MNGLSEFMHTAGAEYYIVKEQYLAKKKEVEWAQREEKLLFSEYVRLSRNFAFDEMRGCARLYFDDFSKLLHKEEKLGRKEKKQLAVYNSIFCENFFPDNMQNVEITGTTSYGYDNVGKEFYFRLGNMEYGLYVPNPENINEKNFNMFGGEVVEFEVIEHTEEHMNTVLLNTHSLSKIKEFLSELAEKKLSEPVQEVKKKRGRPKKEAGR